MCATLFKHHSQNGTVVMRVMYPNKQCKHILAVIQYAHIYVVLFGGVIMNTSAYSVTMIIYHVSSFHG